MLFALLSSIYTKSKQNNVEGAKLPILKEKLKVAASTIKKDESDTFFSDSLFVTLFAHVMVNGQLGVKYPPIYSFLKYISQDINNLEVITSRLAWEKTLWNENQLDIGDWMMYAVCDIDIFHVEIRSIFDYIAKVLVRVSDNPSQVPDEGFNDLRNWLTKSEVNAQRLGSDLSSLVLSCDWFDQIKTVRDINIHQGGMTLVFPEKGRILFQILKGYKNLVFVPDIMYNENVVDFERYAGMYFGYLVSFLEEFASIIRNRLPEGRFAFGVGNPRKVYGKRLPTVYIWIDNLLLE